MARAALVLILALGVAVPAFGFDFSFGAKDYVTRIFLEVSNVINNGKSDPKQTEETIQDGPRFHCPSKNGLFPNYEDCTTFFQCAEGQHYLKQCPANLHFSKETQRCEYPCDAQCDEKLACQCKWDSCNNECQQPRDAGPCDHEKHRYFYNSSSHQCEHFIYGGCKGNQNNFKTYEKCIDTCVKGHDRCGPHEKYVESKSLCNDCKRRGNCSPPILPQAGCDCIAGYRRATTNALSPCIPESRCPDREFDSNMEDEKSETQETFQCTTDGLHPNPRDCRTFYECSNEKAVLMKCPGVLHFSSRTERCENVCNAHCEKSLACDCKWESCKGACDKPVVRGPCNHRIPRYYFNQANGQCEKFFYGGCQGNENNFGTLEDCQQSCTDLCDLPPEKGPCDGEYEHWYYDSQSEECRPFIYGGCGGNPNRFDSGVLCYDRCVLRNIKGTEDQSSQPSVEAFESMSISTSQKDWQFDCTADGLFQNTENCSTFVHCYNGQANLKTCPTGLHYNNRTQGCESPCDARCDQTLEEECCWNDTQKTVQAQKSVNARCRQKPDQGTCGAFRRRYYFDFMTGYCKKFFYSGCGGNSNNFMTFKECEDSCLMTRTVDADICNLQAEKGPCNERQRKYFYDAKSRTCKEFKYGGCEGNANNFETIELCNETCAEHAETKPQNSESHTNELAFRILGEGSVVIDFICSENGLYPDPNSCEGFLQCSNGIAYRMQCPAKLHFSMDTKRCEKPCDAHCNKNIACQCGWPECSETYIDCEAPPAAGSCNNYQDRYYYNRYMGKCQKFQYGGCGGNTNNFVSAADCKLNCVEKMLNGYRCPRPDGKFSDFFDCITYYDCKNNIPTRKRCPDGLAFDHWKSTCVIEYEASCLYKCRDRDAVYPFPPDCHKYIDCVNGIAKVESCEPGTAFDFRVRNCVEEKYVLCLRN